MIPDRLNLQRMLANLDASVELAQRAHPDEHDFRVALRASVRLMYAEAGDADHAWLKGQLEELMARRGLKDLEI